MSLRFAKDELRYYVYLGRSPMKKVKTLVFHPGVPGPVWDRKIHALMTRLPYFRLATEAEISTVEAKGKQVAKAAPVKKVAAKAPALAMPDIPADWRKSHHKSRMKWAKDLTGSAVATAAEADAILAAYMEPEPKSAPQMQTPEPVDREFADVFAS